MPGPKKEENPDFRPLHRRALKPAPKRGPARVRGRDAPGTPSPLERPGRPRGPTGNMFPVGPWRPACYQRRPMAPASPEVLHVFATFAAGGAQVRATDLMNAFGAELRHAVLALDGVVEARDRIAPGVELELLPAPPKAGSLATARRLRALLAERRPDLVLTYNFGAVDTLLAARTLPGVRLVHHEDGFHADEAHGLKRRRSWLRRLALPAARHLVVISRNLERIALEVWRQPRERVVYLPNGIDVTRYADEVPLSDERAGLGLPEDAVVVVSVGHLRPEKNVARLLDAARLALEGGAALHLVLLGDGPERASLERSAAEGALAGRVHFAGYHTDPRPWYRAADVFALPSDTEQMPMALLEAMASARPAVCTDVGDVRALLPEPQQPFVVPLGAGCVAGLAAALTRLASDPALRSSLGSENRARAVERFDRGAMIASYRDLYGRVLQT